MKTILAYVTTFTLATIAFTAMFMSIMAGVILFISFMTWTWDIHISHPWILARGLLGLGAVMSCFFMFSREARTMVASFKEGWDRA